MAETILRMVPAVEQKMVETAKMAETVPGRTGMAPGAETRTTEAALKTEAVPEVETRTAEAEPKTEAAPKVETRTVEAVPKTEAVPETKARIAIVAPGAAQATPTAIPMQEALPLPSPSATGRG